MVHCTDDGTLVPGKGGTLPGSQSGTLVELESELGTMVINSDVDEQTMKSNKSFLMDSTLKYKSFLFSGHATGSAQGAANYRPLFLAQFDKKDEMKVIK